MTRWGREDIEDAMRPPRHVDREEREELRREQALRPAHCMRCTAWRGCYLVDGKPVCRECL